MEIRDIPFAEQLGIEKSDDGTVILAVTPKIENHMKTIHAAAQFALAETQSGFYLQEAFPELEGKVIAVLRGSTVKYKHPATTTIRAEVCVEEESKEKFLQTFEKKLRASISVSVVVKDLDEVVTMQGEFTWFVQSMEVEE